MALRVTGGILRGRKILVPKTAIRPTQDRVRAAIFSSLRELIPGARVLDLCAGSGAIGLEAFSRGASIVYWVESDRKTLAVLNENVRRLCGLGKERFPRLRQDAPRLSVSVASSPPRSATAERGATPAQETAAGRNGEATAPKPWRRRVATAEFRLNKDASWLATRSFTSDDPRTFPATSETCVVMDDAIRFLRRGMVEESFDLIFADPPYDPAGEWLKKILSALSEGSMLANSGLFVMEMSAKALVVAQAGWRVLKTRVYGETQVCFFQKTMSERISE